MSDEEEPPEGVAIYTPTSDETRRTQAIWDRLALNPGLIDPNKIDDLKVFEPRDSKFMNNALSMLENDLRYRWADEDLPQPTFEQRQLVLQVRYVVQQMWIYGGLARERFRRTKGSQIFTLEDPQKFLLTRCHPEELTADEDKDCPICSDTFGVTNNEGILVLPYCTPCHEAHQAAQAKKTIELSEETDPSEFAKQIQRMKEAQEAKQTPTARHVFCRPCFNQHLRVKGAGKFAGFDVSDSHENSSSSSPQTQSNNANDNAHSNSGHSTDSEGSQSSEPSEYTVGSDDEPTTGWPRCPKCRFELDMSQYLGPYHQENDPKHPSPPWMVVFRPDEAG